MVNQCWLRGMIINWLGVRKSSKLVSRKLEGWKGGKIGRQEAEDRRPEEKDFKSSGFLHLYSKCPDK